MKSQGVSSSSNAGGRGVLRKTFAPIRGRSAFFTGRLTLLWAHGFGDQMAPENTFFLREYAHKVYSKRAFSTPAVHFEPRPRTKR